MVKNVLTGTVLDYQDRRNLKITLKCQGELLGKWKKVEVTVMLLPSTVGNAKGVGVAKLLESFCMRCCEIHQRLLI